MCAATAALSACTATHPSTSPAAASPRPTPTPPVAPPSSSAVEITVQAAAVPPSVPTGRDLHLIVTTASTHGQAGVASIDWGDGTRPENELRPSSCPAMPAPLVSPAATGTTAASPTAAHVALPGPSQRTERFQHRYRQPGRRTITLRAASQFGCSGPLFTPGSATGRTDARVTGDAQPGNGSDLPQPEVGIYSYSGGVLHGDIRGLDADGYVRTLKISWPDGSSKTFTNATRCADPGNTWPYTQARFAWTHPVSTGRQTLRATVTSTDCSSGHQQVRTDLRYVQLTRSGWSNAQPANRVISGG